MSTQQSDDFHPYLFSLCPPCAPAWLQKAAEKNPAERKGGTRGRPSRCSPHPALVSGRQLLALHCGGAQRGRDGPFRAEVTSGLGLAPTRGSPESLQPCREDPHKSCPLPFEPGFLSGSLCGCPGWVMPSLGQAALKAKNSQERDARPPGQLRGLLQPCRASRGEHPPPSRLYPHHLAQAPANIQPHSISITGFGPNWGKTLTQSTKHLQEADNTKL